MPIGFRPLGGGPVRHVLQTVNPQPRRVLGASLRPRFEPFRKFKKFFAPLRAAAAARFLAPPGATPLFGGRRWRQRRPIRRPSQAPSGPAVPSPLACTLPCEVKRVACPCAFAAESVGSSALASYTFPSEIMRLAHASDSTDDRPPVKSAAETGTAGASAAEKSGRGSPRGGHPAVDCRGPHASGSRRAPERRAHPLPAPSDELPSSRFDRFRGHPVGVKSPTGVQGRIFVEFKLFSYTFFF